MSTRDASIVAQTAAKAAATLFAGTGNLQGFQNAHREITLGILQIAEEAGGAPATVAAAPAPQAAAAPVAQPDPVAQATQVLSQAGLTAPTSAIGPESREEELWADLLANPDDWWDNSDDEGVTLVGGARPEFKHKTIAKYDKSGTPRPLALFLVSRRFNKVAPDAVWAKYGFAKPDLTAPVPAATTAAPAVAPF